jgi:hypothetical protein
MSKKSSSHNTKSNKSHLNLKRQDKLQPKDKNAFDTPEKQTKPNDGEQKPKIHYPNGYLTRTPE